MYTWILVFFTVFLKNRKIISKMKRSKVTDYAALIYILLYIYIYIYALPHSVSLDHYVSGDQERKDKLNISRKKLCTV